MSSAIPTVILAGGQGSRIGGSKPRTLLGGERLIDRALKIAAVYSATIAVAVRDPSQVSPVDARILADDPSIEGPLSGLAAALRFARALDREMVLVIPADMPFLPADLLDRLAAEIGSEGCAIAASGGSLHPVCGLWRTQALERLADFLETRRRSLRGFAKSVGFVAVEWPAEPTDPFFNINSSDDLAAAERRLTA